MLLALPVRPNGSVAYDDIVRDGVALHLCPYARVAALVADHVQHDTAILYRAREM